MDTYTKSDKIIDGADPLESTRGVDAYEFDGIVVIFHFPCRASRSDLSDKPKG